MMEECMTALENDDQLETGEKEEEVICKLEFMEHDDVQLYHKELPEKESTTRLETQLMIAYKVDKWATIKWKETIV